MSSVDILTLPPPPYDARLRYGPDPNQFGDLRLPQSAARRRTLGKSKSAETAAPLVVMVHGGFWRARYDLLHAGHLCAAIARDGFATFNLEYRRVGNPGGGWPGTFEDVMAGFEFIRQRAREHGLDAARTLVMGHSAGGQLALALAAHQQKLAGAVSLAGVLDLGRAYELHLSDDAVVEFLGGTPTEVPEHYHEASPFTLGIPGIPQVIIHGTEDEIVPVDFSRNYVRTKLQRGEQVRLVEIPAVGHFELIDPRSRAWPRVASAVRKLLV